jgi:3',5'-cyclic AMP phosphodiesterase CpdA
VGLTASSFFGLLLIIFGSIANLELISSIPLVPNFTKLYFLFPLCLAPAYRATSHSIEVTRRVLAGWRQPLRTFERSLPRPTTHDDLSFDLLLFADLHITGTAGGRVLPTIDKSRPNDDSLRFVRNAVLRYRPKLVLIAGDITDTGDPSAWQRALTIANEIGVNVCCAPGNHDVSFRYLTNPGEYRLFDQVLHTTNALRFEEGDTSRRLAEFNEARPHQLDAPFPQLFEYDDLGIDVLVLDSNRCVSRSPLTNALGLVGHAQLWEAGLLLKRRTTKEHSLILLLHHHVVKPSGVLNQLLRCVDSEEALFFALQHRAKLVVHGHLHMPYLEGV